MKYQYDIFLGGPWERHTLFPYKTLIKRAFPGKQIFDPELRSAQQEGKWWIDNRQALRLSRSMIVFVPEFPFPGVAVEAGMFYEMHSQSEKPLEQLVVIWPPTITPLFGKKIAAQMGHIVETVEEAILYLQTLLVRMND